MTIEEALEAKQIDRADLEGKLREIEGVVLDVEEDARNSGVLMAVGLTVVVVGLVALGIWRRRRNRIRVEVYRV